WLMLFRMQGESFLCLEPQSHPVNAHNMDGQPGLRVLGAGEKLNFLLKIIIEGA
ncbi:TPA: aldose 1-epimerase, partial [Klebsiella pneumoniae]|nr:aldose 1-epimerase [Klebsiella pneumoniae]HBZ4223154.1 aldose 1-epimerase [Klebsiella pneumoniae]